MEKEISALYSFVPNNIHAKKLEYKSGIEFTVILSHGFGEISSSYTYFFLLNENSKTKIETLLKVLPELKSMIIDNNYRHKDIYTEDYARNISEKINIEYKEVMDLIDPICMSDSKFEDNTAVPESYRVVFSDGENVLVSEGKV